MGHGRILEEAHDVRQRVRLAQRHERRGILLAVLLQAADIDVLDGGVGDFFWLEHLGQLRHAGVRHASDAQVRLIGGAARVHARLREDAEQTRFPYLRQPDDSSLHKLSILAHVPAHLVRAERRGNNPQSVWCFLQRARKSPLKEAAPTIESKNHPRRGLARRGAAN